MTFNIGSQQGNISNVAGNQTNYGNQNVNIAAPPDVLAAVREVIRQLDHLPLPAPEAADAKADLERLDKQMSTGEVSQHQVSQRLTRILNMARNAGAVLTAASSLGSAVTTIAKWLGPIGSSLIAFLV
jgi:hypothetical protein